MTAVSPADFHTSKTLKDMNSDSFTLGSNNSLLWLNNGSGNTPASHNDQVTTSLSLGHAVDPPRQASCMKGSLHIQRKGTDADKPLDFLSLKKKKNVLNGYKLLL